MCEVLPVSPLEILDQEPIARPSRAEPLRNAVRGRAELAIVVPTLNERDNVGPLIDRLDRLLVGVDWEAVFVDGRWPPEWSGTIFSTTR